MFLLVCLVSVPGEPFQAQHLSGTSFFCCICNRTHNSAGRVHGKTVASLNSCAFQTLLVTAQGGGAECPEESRLGAIILLWQGVSTVAWTQTTQCYLPCFPVMKMQVSAYTGQQISCKVAKVHNSRYFISLCPLVHLAEVKHSELLCSMSEGELARWLRGLVPSCIIQLCLIKILVWVLLCWKMLISTNYLQLVDLCTD